MEKFSCIAIGCIEIPTFLITKNYDTGEVIRGLICAKHQKFFSKDGVISVEKLDK